MSDIVIASPDEPDDFERLSSEELRRELARCLTLTAQNLLRMAHLVRVLESRGEDLEGLKIGMVGHLRDIANGTLLPEAVVRFAPRATVLRRIRLLPLAVQRKMAAGESVLLVVYDEAGQRTHRRPE